MENDNLTWLLEWFYSQCDEDWEPSNGVEISTKNNPNWLLKIDLPETELEDIPFQTIHIKRTEYDWIHCFVEENIFTSTCGPLNLPEALQIFRTWAEKCQTENNEEK